MVATAGNTDAGKGSISSGIHAAHDISVDAARLTATAGEAASSAGMGSAFGSITVAGDSVVSASSSAKEGVGISAVSASVVGGKLLASGNFEAARCPKGFTVAPDAGEVMSVATADGVRALPSDVDGLDGVKFETVGGAPIPRRVSFPSMPCGQTCCTRPKRSPLMRRVPRGTKIARSLKVRQRRTGLLRTMR